MKGGFILIEVILGTAIAAIIFAGLAGILSQVNRGSLRTDNTVSLYSRVSLARYLLTRDLLGTTIPCQADVVQDAIEQEKKKQKPAVPAAKPLGAVAAPEKKEEKKTVTRIFYGALSEKQKLLTFITNNPMQTYWSDRAGKPKPLTARVVYSLAPEAGRQDSFVLMRQEGNELDFEAYQEKGISSAIREYEVITGIKSIETSFVYALIPEKEKEPKGLITQQFQQSKKKEKQKIEFLEVSVWDIKKLEEREKDRMPILPNAVKLTFELWDEQYKKVRFYSFSISLPANQAQQMQQAMMPFTPPPKPQPQRPSSSRPPFNGPSPSANQRMRRPIERPSMSFSVVERPRRGVRRMS